MPPTRAPGHHSGYRAIGLPLILLAALSAVALLYFYAPAPAVAEGTTGKAIFEEKCAFCHTVGGRQLAGPDLYEVTKRRDRAWLVRFITAPDRVIAEGDPIAARLLKDSNGLAMPNLKLSEADAEAIVTYLEAPGQAAPADRGHILFEQKCDFCHTIQGGRLVGPDLRDVTARRDPAWLAGFIASPDKLLMANDSLATQLRQEYGGVPMPNMGLAEADVAAILAYLADPVAAGEPAAMQANYTPTSEPQPIAVHVSSGQLQQPQPAAVAGQSVDRGKVVFDQKCAGCHTIGGGRLAGPDLKGVTTQRDRAWLARFITVPDRLLAEKDPTATQLLQEYNNIPMPNLGISEADANAVVDYLASASGDTGLAPAPAAQPAALPPGDPARGQILFSGGAVLQSGAPPCISCHSVSGAGALGGGTLGPDLTQAAAKYGDPGLASVLGTLPFPTMQPIYLNRALAPAEQADLTAYLQGAAAQPPTKATPLFAALSAAGFLLSLALVQLIWRRRLHAVRAPLVAASVKPRRVAQ